MNRDLSYIRHILDAGRRILEYTRDGRAAFEVDLRTQDAVVRNIGVIGEAAGNLSEQFRAAHPAVPWKRIKGMRNELIYRYFRIDLDIVWQTIEVHLPKLVDVSRIDPGQAEQHFAKYLSFSIRFTQGRC